MAISEPAPYALETASRGDRCWARSGCSGRREASFTFTGGCVVDVAGRTATPWTRFHERPAVTGRRGRIPPTTLSSRIPCAARGLPSGRLTGRRWQSARDVRRSGYDDGMRVIAWLVAIALSSGCAVVPKNRRKYLADPTMTDAREGARDCAHAKIHGTREGAAGGDGEPAGGGCGCAN